MVTLINVNFCYINKCVNTWKTCVTERTNIFQMTEACYKIMLVKGPLKVEGRPVNFNVTRDAKFVVLSGSILQLTMG